MIKECPGCGHEVDPLEHKIKLYDWFVPSEINRPRIAVCDTVFEALKRIVDSYNKTSDKEKYTF